MNAADPTGLIKSMMAGGLLLMSIGLLITLAMLGLWLYGLVHCIQHRHDKDRLMWVLINLLGGPVGAILYFALGRQKLSQNPEDFTMSSPPRGPFFDHAAMGDAKKRAREISDSIWASRKKR